MGEWMQLKSLRLSCSTRSLMLASTTSTLFSWRSLTGSRVAMPPGLASANRSSSCVAVEMAWPGGSSLKDKGKWWRFLAWQCRLIWEMQENGNNNKKGQIFLNYSSDKKRKGGNPSGRVMRPFSFLPVNPVNICTVAFIREQKTQ